MKSHAPSSRDAAAGIVARALALMAAVCCGMLCPSAAATEGDHDLEALLARMTLEEKAGQLNLYAPASGALSNPALHLRSLAEQEADIRAGRVTGLFNGAGQAIKRRAQQLAVRESRLGIPLLFAADVIHGFRTVFPVPLAEAASWDVDLAERTARAAAVEAAADGFHWTFAPMVDIARDARWGRGVEGAGEDVLLASSFAQARVRGFQSPQGPLAATAKHFAAYGAAEGGLDYNSAELSPRTLREVVLPPFRAAVQAGAAAVMTSFNDIAGIPSNANPELLTGVLRDAWRFDGVVVSDYTADEELIAHGFAADGREAAKLSLLAGVDVSMQSGLYLQHLPALVQSGEVPMARLDEAVRRVLRLKQRLGLFERPFRGLEVTAPVEWPQHRALAREAARKSIVMLRNEGGLLPLPKAGQRIALIGPFADEADGGNAADLFGPWTLFPGPAAPVSLAQGLRAALADASLLKVVKGSNVDAPLRGGIAAAVAAARRADVVLLALGESAQMSGEARSRTSITLPAAQQALAEAVAATGKPVVVLLRNGRALALEGAVRHAQAILVTWFLGVETGHAVADVLFGDESPSGRLPVSFPQAAGQVPYHYSHRRTGRPLPAQDPGADFKTRYIDATHEALYPFGHGLTYGRFHYEALQLSHARLPWGGTLQVKSRISNRGPREAEETVQLYVHDRVASVARPVRELKDFRKLRLAPGESAEVVFSLRATDLAFIGRDLQPTVEPGVFDVWVAPSATQGQHASFELLASR
jgi:beta-glucosidase